MWRHQTHRNTHRYVKRLQERSAQIDLKLHDTYRHTGPIEELFATLSNRHLAFTLTFLIRHYGLFNGVFNISGHKYTDKR